MRRSPQTQARNLNIQGHHPGIQDGPTTTTEATWRPRTRHQDTDNVRVEPPSVRTMHHRCWPTCREPHHGRGHGSLRPASIIAGVTIEDMAPKRWASTGRIRSSPQGHDKSTPRSNTPPDVRTLHATTTVVDHGLTQAPSALRRRGGRPGCQRSHPHL